MTSCALALLLACAAVSPGGVSRAQQGARVYRVGAIFNRGPNQGDRDVELLRQGLAQRGYVEGTNLVLEARFAEGRLDRLLVAMGVDVKPPARDRREFVISLKVARQLGVTIPPEVLKRADRILE